MLLANERIGVGAPLDHFIIIDRSIVPTFKVVVV
jgi:hypothetical protein